LLPKKNIYMVGSYAFDLASAKNVAFRTVFLNTTEKIYSAEMYDNGEPDVTGSSLVDCVTKMIQFEKMRRHFLVQPTIRNPLPHLLDNIV
jgi:phosphoglycolate phosphatase-like HAD superfamily hydrolase